jgi:hypothetical protein
VLLDLEPEPPPSAALDRFGDGIAPIGDVDGDGVDDLAIAVPRGFFGLAGHVQVTSGATRLPLATLFPDVTTTARLAVAGLGDVDADGYPDVGVGAPSDDAAGADAGQVVVYAGSSLWELRTHLGATAGAELGAALDGLGDVTSDGYDDYLVGKPGAWLLLASNDRGGVQLFSGIDGASVQSFWGPSAGSRFGASVASVGDAHFDLVELSWAAGAPEADTVEVYYALTHTRTLTGASGSGFGTAVCGVGDLDGDGSNEIAVGAPEADLFGPFGSSVDGGRVVAFDAVSGAVLREDFGTTGQRRGVSLADALDFDGDGLGELLVGGESRGWLYDDDWGPEPLAIELPDSGEVRVAGIDLGTALAPEPVFAFGFPGADDPDLDAGEVQLRVTGTGATGILKERLTSRSHARFGASVAMLDDVDGDGTPDLAVGIPFDDRGGAESGAVEVRSGKTGAVLLAVTGDLGAQLGFAVANAGDHDGDGLADVIAGAPRARLTPGTLFGVEPVGHAYVISSADGALLKGSNGFQAGDRFGAAVASAGDYDGDGILDMLIGAPFASPSSGLPIPIERSGEAYVVSGLFPQILWQGSVDADHAYFGTAVANLGDVDGDGYDDLAVSAPGRELLGPIGDHGSVEVYSQGTPLWYHAGSQEEQELGASLAPLGDVDGDGVADLAVGSPGWDAGAGANHGLASVLSGANGAELLAVEGAEGERLGAAVAPAGDVDHDGRPDLAAGAPGYQSPITFLEKGAVRVFHGATGELLRGFAGSLPAQPLGTALAGGVDLDGDGDLELVAGAPGALGDLFDQGAARVLSTHAKGTLYYGAGTPGCAGPQELALAELAQVGGVVDLRCSGVEPGILPVLVISTAADVAGSDALGLGALVHVDLAGLIADVALPPVTGPVLAAQVPVPAQPSLAGATVYAQVGFSWGPGACPAVPAGFSSSTGLAITIQP